MVWEITGDIRYEKGNMKFFFPISTMILVSVGINLLLKFLEDNFHCQVGF